MDPSNSKQSSSAGVSLALDFTIFFPPTKCPDWGARLQDAAIRFWTQPNLPSRPSVESFIRALLDEDNFEVVSLVIRELQNEPASMVASPTWKKDLLMATQHLQRHRNLARSKELGSSNEAYHPLYHAEKDIFRDSDMYRASLLVYHSGDLNDEQKNDLQKWLAKWPGKS